MIHAAALLALVLSAPPAPDDILIEVGPEKVTRRVVEYEMRQLTPVALDDLTPAQREPLRQAAVARCVAKRQAFAELTALKKLVPESRVESAIAATVKALKNRGLTWQSQLDSWGLTDDDYRREVWWQLSFADFVASYATPERVEAHFHRFPREFDGSQARVAHLLLKHDPQDRSASATAKLVAQAKVLREEIVAGKVTFAAAVKAHSQAPTTHDGGDIGFIERHTPMPEEFSAAAFRLEPKEISPPVTTTIGVHLICCLEIKPGKRTIADAREDVQRAIPAYVLSELAARGAKRVEVRYPRE